MSLSLIGPRGSGKSTIGVKLSEFLGLKYVSTDHLIEKSSKLSIPEFVAKEGWLKFRTLEEKALARAAEAEGRLIDTGGGIIEVPANRKMLRAYGPVVWLDAPIGVLLQRTLGNPDRPPLTDYEDPVKEMEETVQRRSSLYRKTADYVAHTGAGDIQQICKEVAAWYNAFTQSS